MCAGQAAPAPASNPAALPTDRNELEAAQKFLEQAAIENLVSMAPCRVRLDPQVRLDVRSSVDEAAAAHTHTHTHL